MPKDRESVPVSLPKGLVQQLDALVEKGEFSSRSEALRFGARLVLMLEKRLHERAEDYAYDEVSRQEKRTAFEKKVLRSASLPRKKFDTIDELMKAVDEAD